jgi:Zn-dependent protease
MRFRLFGAKVEVQLSFWITSVLFGMFLQRPEAEVPRREAVFTWVVVVFVSVLVHELGHALAAMRLGLSPQITLYALGGLTRFQPSTKLTRLHHIFISLAGPFAGFALGGLVLAAWRFIPHLAQSLHATGELAMQDLLWVNFGWGILNLIPVLPLDGGHVLENALGPKRAQLTAAISTFVGFLFAALFVHFGQAWGAVLFGLSAIQSYRRFALGNAPAEEPPPAAEPIPPELRALLTSARRALTDDDLERAATLAQRALEAGAEGGASHPQARREALEIIAWTHLLAERTDAAWDVLEEARRVNAPPVDPALEGAVLLARGESAKARAVLEQARSQGDQRKEVVASLVQALLAAGEVARASDVALSVADTLSDDDLRRIATLASEHGAFGPAARSFHALFERHRLPEDAYEAARAAAQSGHPEDALAMLRSAVAAGFDDRARLLSDAALASVPALDAVLPARP